MADKATNLRVAVVSRWCSRITTVLAMAMDINFGETPISSISPVASTNSVPRRQHMQYVPAFRKLIFDVAGAQRALAANIRRVAEVVFVKELKPRDHTRTLFGVGLAIRLCWESLRATCARSRERAKLALVQKAASSCSKGRLCHQQELEQFVQCSCTAAALLDAHEASTAPPAGKRWKIAGGICETNGLATSGVLCFAILLPSVHLICA